MNISASAAAKPRICTVSQGAFGRLMRKVATQFEGDAHIRIIEQGYDDAIRSAVEASSRGDVDVFVCGGPIREYLSQHTQVPVVEIEVTASDVFRAMLEASATSQRIAYCGYGNSDIPLRSMHELLNVEVEEFNYDSPRNARGCVAQIVSKNYPIVVCPSIPSVFAGELGLKAVLLYSEQSIREAIRKAIAQAARSRSDAARRRSLRTVFEHLSDCMVIVGADGSIHSANEPFAKLLESSSHRRPEQFLGKILQRLSLQPEHPERVSIKGAGGEVKSFEVVAVPFPRDDQEACDTILLLREGPARQVLPLVVTHSPDVSNGAGTSALDSVLGTSAAIRSAKQLAEQYSRSGATVLLTGESGCGKEVFAQAIHKLRCHKGEPFVGINCSALPHELLESELFGFEEGAFSGARRGGKPGLFEIAGAGTLFLDEIGEMPAALQAKLLRVLQEKVFTRLGGHHAVRLQARVIAASNRDLEGAVAARQFREDLFYRLNVLRIRLPALRERPGDVEPILRSALQPLHAHVSARDFDTLLAQLTDWLSGYGWPGNVRELINFAARLANHVEYHQGNIPGTADFPLLFPEVTAAPGRRTGSLATVRRSADAEHVEQVLAACEGDMQRAAQVLGVSRTTLWRRLKGRSAPA
ncbi:MAG: sigma 54-interacting transcriptional regulator [Pseudomonadota bacterium]